MFMSVMENATRSPRVYSEIAGKRVLITGIRPGIGAELALAFGEHDARLILSFDDDGAEVTALTELVAQTATELKVFTERVMDGEAAVRVARAAAQAYGGLDAVINLASLAPEDVRADATPADVDRLVLGRLTAPCLFTRIAANRMQLTMNEGLILNIATLSARPSPAARALAAYTKTALAAMTRAEAQRWAPQGIRVNAVAPAVAGGAPGEPALATDKDLTALALFLTSGRGRALSGHVFDARGLADGGMG